MNVREYIENKIAERKEFSVNEIAAATEKSRQYINKVLQQYLFSNQIVRIGNTTRVRYVPSTPKHIEKAKKNELSWSKKLQNENIDEDLILKRIKNETGIFLNLKNNVEKIIEYAFTEMLNNAVDHSQSKSIAVQIQKTNEKIFFSIVDKGVGIFKNIQQKKNLHNELEAVQDLLKGKQTTMPERHSGEGIFFTSKAADYFVIRSWKKKLIFDNLNEDVFLADSAMMQGTRVDFSLSITSEKELIKIFNTYAGDEYEFATTEIIVSLYKFKSMLVSRSQARRILSGLDTFKTIILDFKNIETIGQGFADEIFRIWKNNNPNKNIEFRNANENVQFMIEHVRRSQKQ